MPICTLVATGGIAFTVNAGSGTDWAITRRWQNAVIIECANRAIMQTHLAYASAKPFA